MGLRLDSILIAVSICAICACDAAEPASSFRVEFAWADQPPAGEEELFVYSAVQQLRDDAEPRTLTTAGPEPYRPGVQLAFRDVPIGRGLRVVVELRSGKDLKEAPRYYGISERFDIELGEEVVVSVRIELRAAPGHEDGQRLEIVSTGEPGYTNSPRAKLRVVNDGAVAILLSNLAGLPADDTQRVELTDAQEQELDWDLDRGLAKPCEEDNACERRVFGRLVDDEGYLSPIFDTRVIVDTRLPALLSDPPIERTLLPSADNPLKRAELNGFLQRVRPGTRVRLAFALSESVTAAPEVTAVSEKGGAPLAWTTLSSEGGNAFVYELDFPANRAPMNGQEAFHVQVRARDRAANEHTTMLDADYAFIVDTAAPAPARAATDGATGLVYERAPWGNARAQAAIFGVRGESGSVEPEAVVEVLDAPDPAQAWPIGAARADADGGIAWLELIPPDRPRVYARVIDAAGNASAVSPVSDVLWGASFVDTGRGNPHRFDSRGWFVGTLEQSDARIEQSVALAQAGDGQQVRVRGGGRFSHADTPEHQSIWFTPAGALDRIRGRVVGYGQRAPCPVSGESCEATWSWNGQRLEVQVMAQAARPFGPLVWDGGRGRLLALDAVADGCPAGTQGWCSHTTFWNGGDTFEPVTNADSIIPRSVGTDALFVYDERRDRVVMFGGGGEVEACFYEVCGDTWEWDGTRWREVVPADAAVTKPSARMSIAGAYDPRSGLTILFGGTNRPEVPDPGSEEWLNSWRDLDDTWTFDGTRWSQVLPSAGAPAQPQGRTGAVMTYSSRLARVVMYGGTRHDASCDGSGSAECAGLWAWSGAHWERIQELGSTRPAGRTDISFVEGPFGELLVLGGRRDSNAAGDCQNDEFGGYLCNGVWTFELESNLDGAAQLRGRWRNYADDAVAASAELILASDTHPVSDRALGWDASAEALVMVIGDAGDRWEGRAWDGLEDVLCQDPFQGTALAAVRSQAWIWTGNGFLPRAADTTRSPRYGHALVWSGAHAAALLLGGRTQAACAGGSGLCCDGVMGPMCETSWLLDAQQRLTAGPTLRDGPGARAASGVASITNGDVLMFGGYRYAAGGSATALGDTWLLTSAGWSQVMGDAPAARHAPAFAYDPARKQALLFAGDAGPVNAACAAPLGDTHVFQDGRWQARTPQHTPAPRRGSALAHAPGRNTLLLYGGGSSASCDGPLHSCSDLWEWQGEDWVQIESTDPEGDGDPGPRIGHVMATDPARAEIVLHGGRFPSEAGAIDSASGVWVWHPGAEARPAQVATFDFASASVPAGALVRSLSLAWRGSAESHAGSGLELLAWYRGRFVAATELGFERDGSGWRSTQPDALAKLRYARADSEKLTFALVPQGVNGTHPGYASIVTDQLSLGVQYRLP